MGDMALPPGFRFHPTDEELVGYYLKRKVEGLKIELEVIPVVDLYKYDPWELPDKSFQPKRDMEWYFFCPRDKKYPNGSRTNRATAAGYWKATGKDRRVICQSCATGLRKTLVFYCGRAPAGDRTDWVMHEYRLCEQLLNGSFSFQGAFALCRIVKKNEQGQKALEYHGDHHKGKKIALSPSLSVGRSASNEASNMIFSVNQDHSPFPVNLINGSYESTPICSPSDFRRERDLEPVLSEGNGDVTSYMFQFPTLDTSTEYVKNGESEAENQDINELQYETNSLQQFPDPFVYTSSSYLNPGNELSHMDSMEVTNFYDSFPSLDRMGSPYTNTLTDGFEFSQTPPICRQSSGDGNLADFSNLWFHEDNSMVTI